MWMTLAVAIAAGGVPQIAQEDEKAAEAEFTRLEARVMGAAQLGDDGQLEDLLSPEFAYRLSLENRPDYVLNRAEWFRGSDYYDLKNFEISGLSAHLLGRTAVVGFQLVTSGELGGQHDVSGAYFVTDVWTGGPGRWKLTRRFVSRPVPAPAAR